MSKITAIVLSAGSGKRMKSDIPKQYMDLLGKPVIYYSLKAFQDSAVDEIVLVTGAEDIAFCKNEIVDAYGLTKVTKVAAGGAERYDSVYEGLCAAGDADYVLIHDGARPLLDQEIIARTIETVCREKACVVGMPVKDTIRVIDARGYAKETPERSSLWLMQTPQAFSAELLRRSYHKLYADKNNGLQVPAVTDDAMVVEYGSGTSVRMVEGSYENIKITTPEDIAVAEKFLEKVSKTR